MALSTNFNGLCWGRKRGKGAQAPKFTNFHVSVRYYYRGADKSL